MNGQRVTRFLDKVIRDAIKNGNDPLADTASLVLTGGDPAEAQHVLHIIKADLALCDHGGPA